MADAAEGAIVRLSGPINARNPQADDLDGQDVLVTFNGPAACMSPHWRTDVSRVSRAATDDDEDVQVRGQARVITDIALFRRRIDDLAAMIRQP